MKCKKCGSNISDDSEFCPECGAPVQKKKNKTGFTIKKAVIAGGIVAAVLISFVAIGRPKTISVTEGYKPKFTGSDGYGSVEVPDDLPLSKGNQAEEEFEEKFEKESGGTMDYLFSGGDSAKGDGSKAEAMFQMAGSLSCKWEDENGKKLKQGKLKNGQKIVYACTYDQNAGNKAGYRYTDLNTTYTVKGLKKVQDVDLFDNISVVWEKGLLDTMIPAIEFKDGSIQKKLNDDGLATYHVHQTGTTTAEVDIWFSEKNMINKGYRAKGNETTREYEIGPAPDSE